MSCSWSGWIFATVIQSVVLLLASIVGTVIYDLYALRQVPPWRRVSGDLARMPHWVQLTFTGSLTFAVGLLCGHLYLSQVNP